MNPMLDEDGYYFDYEKYPDIIPPAIPKDNAKIICVAVIGDFLVINGINTQKMHKKRPSI